MDLSFFDELGPQTLGSRLRRLTSWITEDSARVYELYGVGLDPRWFPVFHLLAQEGPRTVSSIARRIGHSHASVSQIIKAMKARGIASTARDAEDGRRRVVQLTAEGRALTGRLAEQCRDVSAAVDELLAESGHDLWAALQDFERAIQERGLHDRVRERFEARGFGGIRIEDYTEADAQAFMRLNREWIEKHFELEPADLELLSDPAGILLAGGHIFMAREGDTAVGTCALLRMDDETFELAKMAVTKSVQGKGVGSRLGREILSKARELGARRVYLESNRKLEPAIRLYHRLGFREVRGPVSPYARCDIQMELDVRRQSGCGA
jgi:DNA-binding MarR family transcriptional regulator/predicted GNAT family N-acyltransferase